METKITSLPDLEKRRYAITRKSDGFYFAGTMHGAQLWQKHAPSAPVFNLRTSALIYALKSGFKIPQIDVKRLPDAE